MRDSSFNCRPRCRAAPAVSSAEWRYLAMLNYQVDPDLVRPLAPRSTEIDSWEGKTYLSMVGFLFLDTRLLGVPPPFTATLRK